MSSSGAQAMRIDREEEPSTPLNASKGEQPISNQRAILAVVLLSAVLAGVAVGRSSIWKLKLLCA
jgi:hypothetical protein